MTRFPILSRARPRRSPPLVGLALIAALALSACGGQQAAVVPTPRTIVVTAPPAQAPAEPTEGPAAEPTAQPTAPPTQAPDPTAQPTARPTQAPTAMPTKAPPTAIPTPAALGSTAILERYAPSTIFVVSEVGTGLGNQYSSGSGFLYDKSGLIVTNAHVIEGAARVKVYFQGQRATEGVTPQILGRSTCDDLAVLKIAPPRVPPMRLGDSGTLVPGSRVFALGYPLAQEFGEDPTVTSGEVNGLGRTIDHGFGQWQDAIQTDTVINPGNSGGPLFNERGEVIGINSGKRVDEGVQGVNYAISINAAKDTIRTLQGGRDKDWHGMLLIPNSAELQQQYNLPTDRGVVVARISTGSPAEKAGIQSGDIIYQMERGDVASGSAVCDIVKNRRPGDEVRVDIVRGAQLCEGNIVVAQRGGRQRALRCAAIAQPTPTADSSGGGGDGDDGGANGEEPDYTSVVSEAFEDDAGSFQTGSGEGYRFRLAGGKYIVDLQKDASVYSTSTEDDATIRDGAVSVTAELEGKGLVGVVGRLREVGGEAQMYMCYIDNTAEFACLKRVGGEWAVLDAAQKSSAIKPNAQNTMQLAVVGNGYSFYVNDQRLASGADDAIKQAGGWGVYAETTAGGFRGLWDEIEIFEATP